MENPVDWYLDKQIGRIHGTILRVEPDILDAGIFSSRCFAFIELDNGEIIFVWWNIFTDDWRERIGTRQPFNIEYMYYVDRIDILPTPRFGVESVWTTRKDEIYKEDWEILPNGQVRERPIVHKR